MPVIGGRCWQSINTYQVLVYKYLARRIKTHIIKEQQFFFLQSVQIGSHFVQTPEILSRRRLGQFH